MRAKQMKSTVFLFIAVSVIISLFSGCICLNLDGQIKPKLIILQADYGIEDSWLDITAQAKKAARNNCLNIQASNDIAGDPLYGKQKVLHIKYRLGDEEFTKQVNEGQWLNIP